ncbi:MAG: AAA family ATPase [Clostridia bacterium]|nr:AAA family ATPase [Clostridia bacterium]
MKNNNLDDLMQGIFAGGRIRGTAKDKEKTPSAADALASVQKTGSMINEELRRQLEELQKMTDELDLGAIEKEVEKDFGISPKATAKSGDERRGAEDVAGVFEGLAEALGESVIGQERFLRELVIAFKRPYVMDWDRPEGARNVIFIHGSAYTGKHEALNGMARLLKERGLFGADSVQKLDMAMYPGQDRERIFLQDLYMALQSDSEVLLIENYESSHPAFLGQLADLAVKGRIMLNTRYVLQNGRLLDAGNALTPDAIGAVRPNGKYLVFISEKGTDKLAGAFGAAFVNAIGDICATDKLSDGSVYKIAELEYAKLCKKAEEKLGFRLTCEGDAAAFLQSKRSHEFGIGSMLAFCRDWFRALAQYKLEHGAAQGEVKIYTENGLEADFGSGRLELMSLLPGAYKGELESVKAELDEIIGLREIKEYIFSLEDHYKVQQMRKEQGMRSASLSMHMIFTGNPGTGKTTIARIVSKYLKAIGVLSGGQLVEVTRADLVGKYVGHTAPLTTQVIKSALGGVLFIDEAYSLYRGKDDSFGLEAIDTLVKEMEDHRDDLLVILAGYSKEMAEFMTANSGLRSRFPNIIEFPDYTGEELLKIALSIAKGKGYELTEAAQASLLDYFNIMQAMDSRESGNGRLARNVVEKAILDQSRRLVAEPESRLDLLEERDFDLFEKPDGE